MVMAKLRTRKPEPVPVLSGETMVVCMEGFRPSYISREIEKGQWLPLGHPIVQASREYFAVPLSQLEGVKQDGR
jgi:hypothetical protein